MIYDPIPNYYIYYARTLSLSLSHTHTGKYGVAAGAVFGSIMWMLVVSLSDKAEGKPSGYGLFMWCYVYMNSVSVS